MSKTLYITILGLSLPFLGGCQKYLGLSSVQSSYGSKIYIVAGQSNANYLYQKQDTVLTAQLGALALLNTAVPSTGMSRWTAGGDLYLDSISVAQQALTQYPGSYIAGIIFWQGESDVDNGPNEAAWPGRFRAMVQGYQQTFPNVPIVFAQITDYEPEAGREAFRIMQAEISLTGVTMVSTAGITIGGNVADGTPGGDHTDNAGYATMAQRFILALKGEQ